MFAEKIIQSRNHLIRIILGPYNGSPAWWILKVNPTKFEIYRVRIKQGKIGNLEEYGEVIEKGWGKDVPSETLEKIKEYYS